MKLAWVLALWCASLTAESHNALLPRPQKVRYGSGRLPLNGLTVSSASPEDAFTLKRLSEGLGLHGGRGSRSVKLIRTNALEGLPESGEAYQIRIRPNGGEVRARSSAGLFYGAETLLQLVERDALPEVEIDDWPSLAYRGVMFDLSHGPLPTVEEIKRQIDFLARWKGNQYYFYSELSIELKGYPLINPGGRYTQDDVRSIIAYARERYVDVVPCLEFYGHLHDLFRIERYAGLAALRHGGDLDARNPEMQRMVADWVEQMTALFPSLWFHIGLDEPWELERTAHSVDPGELYLEHLKRVAGLARARGKKVLFWADVTTGAALFEKYPQLASSLPEGTIPVPWQYEAGKDFSRMLEPFARAHVPQVIGTGIWGWDTITPDFHETFGNIDNFLRDGRKFGTIGIVNTNWADDAQVLFRMTWPGVAYGAAAAWQAEPMDRAAFFREYSAHLYGAAAEDVAAALAALDEAQQSMKAALGSEDMFRLWDDPFASPVLNRVKQHVDDLRKARLLAETAQEHLTGAAAKYPDTLASLLFGARLMDYAGMKFLYAVEIAENYGKIGPDSKYADMSFWLGRQAATRNHSRMSDLMDVILELRDVYRARWMDEYTTYRLGSALGRFDAEFEYWRRMQAKFWDLRRTYRQGSSLPPLDSLR